MFGIPYNLNGKVDVNTLTASVNGEVVLEAVGGANQLTGAGIALISEVGRIGCDHVELRLCILGNSHMNFVKLSSQEVARVKIVELFLRHL